MKKRVKEAFAEMGISVVEYYVMNPVVEDDDEEPLAKYHGKAFVRGGVDVFVIEHEPRGWGGDGRYYVREKRTADGELAVGGVGHKLEREAIATAVRMMSWRRMPV